MTKQTLEELWDKHCIAGSESNPTDTMYYEQFMEATTTLRTTDRDNLIKEVEIMFIKVEIMFIEKESPDGGVDFMIRDAVNHTLSAVIEKIKEYYKD